MTGVASVLSSTVTSTSSAVSGIVGNGARILSVINIPDGTSLQNVIPEKGNLLCTTDSYANGATAGQETFTFTAEPAESDKWAVTWPTGSGVTQTVTATGPDNNLIVDGNFEEWTGTSPTDWTISVGVAGTTVVKSTAVFYPWDTTGTSLSFVGNSSVLHSIYQAFDSTINSIVLAPLTSYALCFRLSGNGVLVSAGTFNASLRTSAGAAISSPAGVSNTYDIQIDTLTTSWETYTVEFITPKNIPSDARLVFDISVAGIDTGEIVYIDSVMFVAMTPLYEQGPRVAVFAGSTPFVNSDGWVITDANAYGGGGSLDNFQTLFDRLFDMRSLGIQLPHAGSPTIANTLISS